VRGIVTNTSITTLLNVNGDALLTITFISIDKGQSLLDDDDDDDDDDEHRDDFEDDDDEYDDDEVELDEELDSTFLLRASAPLNEISFDSDETIKFN